MCNNIFLLTMENAYVKMQVKSITVCYIMEIPFEGGYRHDTSKQCHISDPAERKFDS